MRRATLHSRNANPGHILGMLSDGVPHDEILRDFRYLGPEDIKAALAYAAGETDHGGGRRGVS